MCVSLFISLWFYRLLLCLSSILLVKQMTFVSLSPILLIKQITFVTLPSILLIKQMILVSLSSILLTKQMTLIYISSILFDKQMTVVFLTLILFDNYLSIFVSMVRQSRGRATFSSYRPRLYQERPLILCTTPVFWSQASSYKSRSSFYLI
jgi:hypothetical protein